MSGGSRPTAADLKRRLFERGFDFGYFQLLHLLEVWLDRPVGIGQGGPFAQEALRLRPDPSLSFSPADVRRVEKVFWQDLGRGASGWLAADDPDRPAALRAAGAEGEVPQDLRDPGRRPSEAEREAYRVTVNFMGLYGVAAPAPVYLSELVNFSDVDGEELTDFLDLFNHRLLSFYYQAWRKYRYAWRYEAGARDEFSGYLLSFIGLGDEAARQRARVPAPRLIRYLGLLGPRTRPAVSLERLLSDYFGGVAVQVLPWILRWVAIPPASRNRLGEACSSLGVDLCLGEKVPDRAGKFRVSLGPLSLPRYQSFLPGTPSFRRLCDLVHLWVGDRFDYDVELIVRREDVPASRFGGEVPLQLGWTSWVSSVPGGLDEDPSVVFPKEAQAA